MRKAKFNEKHIVPIFKAQLRSFLQLLIIGLLLAATSYAQQLSSRPDRGFGGKGGYQSTDIDSISLQNGGLNVTVPLASLPPIAGGKLSYTLTASYNSKLWDIHRSEAQGTIQTPGCQPAYGTQDIWPAEGGAGWQIGAQYQLFFRDAHDDYDYIPPTSFECYSYDFYYMQGRFFKPMLRTPDGSEHELRIQGYWDRFQGTRQHLAGYYKQTGGYPNYPTFSAPVRMYTIDGTYMTVTVSATSTTSYTYDIYLKDGTRIETSSQGQRTIDPNGNSILQGYATGVGSFVRDEQTGREIRWSGATYNGLSATKVDYQTVGGGWQSTYVVYGMTTVSGKIHSKTGWNAMGGEMGGGDVCSQEYFFPETQIGVIREIILPVTEQGVAPQKYTFAYNSDTTETTNISGSQYICGGYNPNPPTITTSSHGWGELSDITTPGGAHIKYNYSNDGRHDFRGFGGMDDEMLDEIVRNTITSKVLTHDGTTETWTYSINNNGTNWVTGGSVTNPDGSSTSEMYNPANIAYAGAGNSDGSAGRLVKTNQSGRILTERKWTTLGGITGAIGSIQQVSINSALDTEFTTLLADDGLTRLKIKAKKFLYDYNGELTQTIEYDWFEPNTVTYTNPGTYLSMPASVPSSATVLRVTNNSYYNQASGAADPNAYQNRTLGGTSTVILGKIKESGTGNGTTNQAVSRFSYDGLSYGTSPTKGNLTQLSRWDDTNSQWVNSGSTYNSYGNAITTTDPKGNVTQIFYEDSTYAMPTKTIVDPQNGTGQQISTVVYDFSTGLPTSSTDINGNTSTISYYNHLLGAVDPFGRPGTTYSPYITIDGVNKRQTTKTFYEDSTRKTRVESDLFNENDGLLKSRETRDQLGRTVLSEKNENGASNYTISSQIVYKTPERVILTSNPTRGDGSTTDGWSRVTNDILGRAIEVATFSGAAQPPVSGTNSNWTGTISTAYAANATTVTDQAGKQKRSIVNAIGQLVRVDEPNDAGQLDVNGSPAQSTSYGYNYLGNLVNVTQGAQTRTFVYNSLSQLKEVNNPESGTILYSYDLNGNLKTRSDARNIRTIYDYDGLNRVIKRCYTIANPQGNPVDCSQLTTPNTNANTLPVTYYYDNLTNAKGKLTKVLTGNVSSPFSVTDYQVFDSLGRVTQSQQITDGTTYNPMTYKYNLSGGIVEEKYPSGRVVRNSFEADGELAQVESAKTPTGSLKVYVNNITYDASGGPTSMRLGNGTWESTQYNSLQQPTQIALGNSKQSTNLLKLNYNYGTNNNNGDILSQTITVPTVGSNAGFTAVQNYTYDPLNRLKEASETISGTQSWKQSFTFDRYGNRNFVEATTTTLPKYCNNNTTVCPADRKVVNPSVSATNNRFTLDQDGDQTNDYGFDAAGNLTKDAISRTFVYDAENKQIEVRDAQNAIIGEYYFDGDGRRIKKYVPATGEVTHFVYDLSGKLVAEYSNIISPTPQVSYMTNDSLGSPRINTNATGQVTSRHDYHPFGEEIIRAGYGADDIRKKFTGYERDSETDLDYAQARMLKNAWGRFTSPDPAMVSASTENPQTWNRYLYVLNNPLKFTDPLGLWEIDPAYDKVEDEKNKNKVKEVKVILKKQAGDDVKTLAKQLNIKESDAQKILDKADANGNIRLSQVGGTIGSTFKGIEEQLRDYENFMRENPDKGFENGWDCSRSTAVLGKLLNPAEAKGVGYNGLDAMIGAKDRDDREIYAKNISEDKAATGDMVRFQKTGTDKAEHWATFLMFNKSGEPVVFSKSGMKGRYEFGTTNQISSRNGYGGVAPNPQNNSKGTGYYRKL